ncbi:MAG TPA: TusE/DsrC/DsvC family sulfur relay protein [Nitrospirota bacterium]|nr:TusE/DsrC/DsvC family sulfur relay protein [Nitrospirota bacterium]
MATILVKNKALEVDEQGYLSNADDWSRDVAEYYAEVEGIRLTEHHWEIIHFLRNYYLHYQIAPMIKILLREISRKRGPDRGSAKNLYELYPNGPAKQACKIAGLPGPAGCV